MVCMVKFILSNVFIIQILYNTTLYQYKFGNKFLGYFKIIAQHYIDFLSIVLQGRKL
jgi:hypothetical protein